MQSLPVDVVGILRGLNVIKPASEESGNSTENTADAFLALLKNKAACEACVTQLFPDGIPRNLNFFEHLDTVSRQFDPTRSREEALGLLWSAAMHRLPAEGREALLTSFIRLPAHAMIELLASLWHVTRDHAFPASFLAEWFVDLVRVIEHDFLQDGGWMAIRVQCDRRVETALEILRQLPTPSDNTRLNIAAFILGVLRTSEFDDLQSNAYREIESFYRDHPDLRLRRVFHWSWATTVRDRTLTREEFDNLFSRAGRSSDDRETVIGVVCQLLAARFVTGETAQRCRDWISAQLSQALSSEAKSAVVRAAHSIVFHVQGGAEPVPDLSVWILSIQPVLLDDVGTWQRICAYLCDLLKSNRELFSSMFVRLTATDAATILQLMQDRQLSRLLRDMQVAGLGNLVGRICVSHDMDTRRLGLYLFDNLAIPNFPEAELATSDIASRLLFYESQRVVLSPKSIARILVAVAKSAAGVTDGFHDEVFDELKLQAHNFAGECRTELGSLGKAIHMVTTALDDVASYFTDLKRAHEAGINAMEVAGHRRAASAQQRRFSRQVAKSAESGSAIFNFTKPTRLLYGKTVSMFLGGQLGDAMPLAKSSVSMELPLIDFCDPEEMAMRRLHASRTIDRLLEFCTGGEHTEERQHE